MKVRKFDCACEPEWLEQLDALVSAMGLPSRAAVLERLAAEKALSLGMEPIRRLTPSKYDPWLPPHERAAAG